MTRLPPRTDLDWTDDGAPRSRANDDVYFSRAGGLEETRTVFLGGCGLPERWRDRARFAIGELGFGTGLNALAAWEMWRRTRAHGAVLHYVSVEGFPLTRDEAARAHAAFPEIAALSARLLARWPVRARGAQRLWFEEDGFALTVIHDEAEAALAGLAAAFDAWFLDGFAPARNEGMWSAALLQRLAALSAPDARAATYSVAGAVRRALTDAGFAVEKAPGFAGKRERLEARLETPPPAHHTLFPYASAEEGPIAVIGAGIAGASVAYALRRHGRQVIVLEAADALGAGASGNAAGLVMPRLDRTDAPLARLHRAAYLEAVALYDARDLFASRGVAEIATDAEEEAALADLLADPPLPEDWFAADPRGAFHARAGVVRPRAVLESLLADVDVRLGADVMAIARTETGWRLSDARGETLCETSAVVIASGAHLARFAETAWLPLELSRGQIEHGGGATLPNAMSGDGYAAPLDGGVLFGATFDRVASPDVQIDAASRAQNIEKLMRIAPEIPRQLQHDTMVSRVGVRTATPDRAPLAGLAPDAAAFNARHAGLAQGRPTRRDADAPAHRGLYMLGGLGSRGFTLAPLLGERIAAEICGEPQALDTAMLDAVHPARFLLRALKRGKPLG